MRPAQEIMAQLAGSNLTPEQLALVMELSAAVATEARPIVDSAAQNKRSYDREYQRERRKNRTKSHDTNDNRFPPKEKSNPHSVSDETGGEPPPDPSKLMFDLGIELLTSQGKTEKEARSLVGSWRKGGRQDGEIAGALVEAKQRSISNLVEWMPRRLNGTRRGTDPPSYLDYLTSQTAGAPQ
jgi:hypothetical protein